jgi:hypothetical protein
MAHSQSVNNDLPILSQNLLLSLAEEIKLPLIQIARLSEQSIMDKSQDNDNLRVVQSTADSAIRLIDNYLLGIKLSLEPAQLNVESVSVSSILYDTCQALSSTAKNYGVNLDLSIGGRYGPVLANRQGLMAALISLGTSLIEAMPALEQRQLNLQLATHRSRYGVVAGIYANTKQISKQALNLGNRLQFNSRQPLVNLTYSSGAGIFVANHILKAMDLNLSASRHHSLYGLGTVLKPNNQLQLVT